MNCKLVALCAVLMLSLVAQKVHATTQTEALIALQDADASYAFHHNFYQGYIWTLHTNQASSFNAKRSQMTQSHINQVEAKFLDIDNWMAVVAGGYIEPVHQYTPGQLYEAYTEIDQGWVKYGLQDYAGAEDHAEEGDDLLNNHYGPADVATLLGAIHNGLFDVLEILVQYE